MRGSAIYAPGFLDSHHRRFGSQSELKSCLAEGRVCANASTCSFWLLCNSAPNVYQNRETNLPFFKFLVSQLSQNQVLDSPLRVFRLHRRRRVITQDDRIPGEAKIR